MFPWLTVELTNRCNKACHFCGRAADRKQGNLAPGDMEIGVFKKILSQFDGSILQFNKDGEPLLYPYLWEVGYLSRQANKITNIVTNGILLWEKRRELMEFDTICVSVIEDDPEQFNTVKRFTEAHDIPVTIKFLGDYRNPEFETLGLRTTSRSIHHPNGDFGYKQNAPVIPELGICLDFLMKPSISWDGKFHICNRYDPEGKGIIGDATKQTLKELWEGRKGLLASHVSGHRDIPLCDTCQFWGVPTCG